MFPVETLTQPARRLIGLPHRGAYSSIGAAFEKLGAVMAARGLWPRARGMAALYLDDPGTTPEADLRSFAGALVDADLPLPEGLEQRLVPAGRFAVLHFRGPYAGLQAAYDQLYNHWLPASGEEPRDAPALEVYLNSPMDTAPDDLLTDICLPLT
jgi:AraC family transcriptional regulator